MRQLCRATLRRSRAAQEAVKARWRLKTKNYELRTLNYRLISSIIWLAVLIG